MNDIEWEDVSLLKEGEDSPPWIGVTTAWLQLDPIPWRSVHKMFIDSYHSFRLFGDSVLRAAYYALVLTRRGQVCRVDLWEEEEDQDEG